MSKMTAFKLKNQNTNESRDRTNLSLNFAKNYAGELSIDVLPLENIELDPENSRDMVLTLEDAMTCVNADDLQYERKKQDWQSLESLSKTIKNDELINPILVYRYGTKCRLIAGERRTLASAMAGKKVITARILNEKPSEEKLRILQWIENNEREDFSFPERIACLKAIEKEHIEKHPEVKLKKGITPTILEDLLGISNTQARRYHLILTASPQVIQAIDDGIIDSLKLAEQVCLIEDFDKQKELITAIQEGLSYEELVKYRSKLQPLKSQKREIGRKRTNVVVGSIKPNVAKILIDALLSARTVENKFLNEISSISSQIKWEDRDSIERSFKKIIVFLSKNTELGYE